MKLGKLIEGLKVREIIGDTQLDIEDIAHNSKKVSRNGLFVARTG